MAITPTQISDLRADFGDANSGFSDEEIERIWDRMAGASDTTTQYKATLGTMFYQARNNAAKFHDVSVAGDSHKLSQLWSHWDAQYRELVSYITAAEGSKRQVRVASTRPIPRPNREKPRT